MDPIRVQLWLRLRSGSAVRIRHCSREISLNGRHLPSKSLGINHNAYLAMMWPLAVFFRLRLSVACAFLAYTDVCRGRLANPTRLPFRRPRHIIRRQPSRASCNCFRFLSVARPGLLCFDARSISGRRRRAITWRFNWLTSFTRASES